MKTEKELRVQLGNLQTRIDKINLDKKTEHRDFTDEERQELERLMSEQDIIVADIEKAGTADRAGKGLERFNRVGETIDLNGESGDELARARLTPFRSYREHFGEPQASEFRTFTEFVAAVQGGTDKRLRRVKDETRAIGVQEGIPSAGGFAIGEEFSSQLLTSAIEDSVVLKRALFAPMKTPTLKLVNFDVDSHATSLFGGVQCFWTAEGGSLTETHPKLRQIVLEAKKITGLTYITGEWQQDFENSDATVLNMLSKCISWYSDLSLIRGTGVGQPQGIMNSPSKIIVPAVGAQPANTICKENIDAMTARLHPGLIKSARWIANTTTKPQLKNISQPVGTGGSAVPYLRKEGDQYFLDDIALDFTEKCNLLGDEGDLILYSPQTYIVSVRGEISLDSSIHVAYTTGEVVFRAIYRLDAMSTWSTAVQPYRGDTTSNILTLAERA